MEQKRTYLAQRLKKIGFNVLPAQGSYFLMADFRWAGRQTLHVAADQLLCIGTFCLAITLCLICRPLLPEGSNEDDVGFCNRITVEAGVTALPVRAVVPQHFTCVHTHAGILLPQLLLSLWAELAPWHVQQRVASRTLCLTYILHCR